MIRLSQEENLIFKKRSIKWRYPQQLKSDVELDRGMIFLIMARSEVTRVHWALLYRKNLTDIVCGIFSLIIIH